METTRKKSKENCPHYSVNRSIDQWFCTVCGKEFVPK